MKTLNTYFRSTEQLNAFIDENAILDSKHLLIQVFTSSNDKNFIASLTSFLDTVLPASSLIGSTTDGEILNGDVSTMQTVISFTQFESTVLKTYISDTFDTYKQAGTDLAESLNQENTKVIISFIDGLHGDGEEFLNAIDSVNPKITVAGGMAGDNGEFKKTFVFTKENIYERGVVGVALSNEALNVYTDYSFNWVSIGLNLRITQADGNRVFKINDKTAYEVYAHYLGESAAKALPEISVTFPLIIKRNKTDIARTVISSEVDGSLIFSGGFKEGDTVRFGYGDSVNILGHIDEDIKRISKHPVESIFIYSCMGRRRFLPELIEQETKPFNEIATTCGFFTYGEFYSAKSKELLNQSMTVLGLSESNEVGKKLGVKKTKKKSDVIEALSNLIKTSSQDLEILNITLENKVEDEIEKNREKTKQIIEHKKLFETVFNKSKDGFFILKNSKIIDGNNSTLKILNLKNKKDLLNSTLLSISPEYQANGEKSSVGIDRILKNTLENGASTFEWIHKKSDGKEFWSEITLSLISQGNKTMFFSVLKDIDEKKKTELELEQLTKTLEDRVQEQVDELREKDEILFEQERQRIELAFEKEQERASNEAKSNFLANMSHEIRTPLNAILGFVDLLREEDHGRKSLDFINIIDESSKGLLQIIEDILDFSKIESGKLEVDKIDFNTKKELEIVSQLFLAKCSQKDINLSVSFSDNIPVAIHTDPLRIKQIISNLISNAIKFTQAYKSIYVKFGFNDGALSVSVKDEGKGISKDKLEHIFEAFNQEDSSTTREYGGTGLGLSISSELTRLLGGELKVKSTLGEGSEFYFSIPVEIAKMVKEKSDTPELDTFDGKKILLVEDNKANQIFMELVLERLEVDLDIANDGLEAIDAFKQNKYDIILMDENMPNLNGIEATKKILELEQKMNLKHTPIVALTANALKGDRERFLEAGMDEYMTKPLDRQKLSSVLSMFFN